MRSAPPNPHGLTHLASYDDFTASPRLELQLTDTAVASTRLDLPQIVGMGGVAHLILYRSARTVLVVPHLLGDQYAEDYFYFAGMDDDQARAADWIAVYDACQALDG